MMGGFTQVNQTAPYPNFMQPQVQTNNFLQIPAQETQPNQTINSFSDIPAFGNVKIDQNEFKKYEADRAHAEKKI